MADAELEVVDRPSPGELAFLEDRIDEFNAATTGFRDGRRLAVWLREPSGRIQAGLAGHTWGGACEIKLVWVAESLRRAGIGRRLLQAAEAEARARGCRRIFLSTHSFQAPGFYRKLGYRAVGEFAGYPSGHGQVFLEKDLA